MTVSAPVGRVHRPSELLVAATAVGLWTYSRTVHRVHVLSPERFRLQRGRLLLAAHRGSSDVPILCGTIYFRGGLWVRRRLHLHFGARDDYFEPGFLAGYPRTLPLPLRRLFYPIDFGPGLGRVRVHPLRSAHRMKLAQILAALPPSAPLERLLPPAVAAELRGRAVDTGRRPPETPQEALDGTFADILWRTVTEDDIGGREAEAIWRRRAAEAEKDLDALVGLVRRGEPLLFFPEGRHSPDGAIGPLVGHGLARLVEEGAPESAQHVAIAYDPLVSGRPRAFVAASDVSPPPRGDVEAAVLDGLRQAMPVTCGQVVAHRLVAAATGGARVLDTASIEDALTAEATEAAEEGRPADPALGAVAGRRRRLGDALCFLERRELLQRARPGSIVLAPPRLLGDPALRRLALEYESAREFVAGGP